MFYYITLYICFLLFWRANLTCDEESSRFPMILEHVVRAGDVNGLRKILKSVSGAVFEERDKVCAQRYSCT
jgi:hypothetical protein